MSTEVESYDYGEKIFYMRRLGYSFSSIAEELSITTGNAIARHRTFQTELAALFGSDEREQIIHLELARLDEMQIRPYMSAISTGDKDDIASVLKIMAHRMKLLGLDQVTPNDSTKIANILVVGDSKQAFIDALNYGRNHLTGADGDDEGDQEERG